MNPFISAFLPILSTPLSNVKVALAAIVASPTVENAVAQGEKLAIDAINPTQIGQMSIGTAAQEALNIISALEAHLVTATSAPSVTTTTSGS